jgi:hypothetical protein
MGKTKIQSTIRVADGAGGLALVPDLRFEPGEWPIRFEVPANLADRWFDHMAAECTQRTWGSSGSTQCDAAENSGSMLVSTGVIGQSPAIDIVWERPRGGDLRIQARPSGTPVLDLQSVRTFLDAVNARSKANVTTREYRRGYLTYRSLPWRGELWLEQNLRLGPPSRHPSTPIGPQIIVVDAEVEGIGWQGVNDEFQLLLRELSIFLNVVVGIGTAVQKRLDEMWTIEVDASGRWVDCMLRTSGYWEPAPSNEMPKAGAAPKVPMRPVERPALEPSGIRLEDSEQSVPEDIVDLWSKLRNLPRPKREQFLRAGSAYQTALLLSREDQGTAAAAFMVVACESLKPAGRQHDDWNIYRVVNWLLGASKAEELRQMQLPPQKLRSEHFHRGELHAGELAPILLRHSFFDPTFDQTARPLPQTTRACIIEWLRRGDPCQSAR